MAAPNSSPLPIQRVLLVLACQDVARARAFYLRAFGWEVKADLSFYVEMEAPTGLRVGLYARDGFERNTGEPSAPRPSGGTTSCELYVYVDDPASALERLVSAGARRITEVAPRAWGDAAGYAADPEGNVVAVARPLDGSLQEES